MRSRRKNHIIRGKVNQNEKFYTQLIPVKDAKGKIHRIIGISRNISNLKLTND
jgi:hypothetical protein